MNIRTELSNIAKLTTNTSKEEAHKIISQLVGLWDYADCYKKGKKSIEKRIEAFKQEFGTALDLVHLSGVKSVVISTMKEFGFTIDQNLKKYDKVETTEQAPEEKTYTKEEIVSRINNARKNGTLVLKVNGFETSESIFMRAVKEKGNKVSFNTKKCVFDGTVYSIDIEFSALTKTTEQAPENTSRTPVMKVAIAVKKEGLTTTKAIAEHTGLTEKEVCECLDKLPYEYWDKVIVEPEEKEVTIWQDDLIRTNPQEAYYKLITTKELHDKYKSIECKYPLPKATTINDLEERTKKTLLEMFNWKEPRVHTVEKANSINENHERT